MKNKQEKTNARERLLNTAIKIFARNGFEGTSTRQLTKEANVNISSIPYYFNNKEGLYKAVLEHIGLIIKTNIGDKALLLRNLLEKKDIPYIEYKNILHESIHLIMGFLLSEKISSPMAVIFLREQMEPTAHFNIIYENLMRPMHEMLTMIVARLCGFPPNSEEAILCAHTLLGQVSVYKTHREAALRRLKWKKYGNKEKEKILQIVLRHTDCVIQMYSQKNANRSNA